MTDFNRVFLMGHIGNDLELKTSPQGKQYLRLSLATHAMKDAEKKDYLLAQGGGVWFSSRALRKLLAKGSPIFVEGSLEPKVFTGKEGKSYFSNSVVAQKIQFLGGKASAKVEPDTGNTEENEAPADDTAETVDEAVAS